MIKHSFLAPAPQQSRYTRRCRITLVTDIRALGPSRVTTPHSSVGRWVGPILYSSFHNSERETSVGVIGGGECVSRYSFLGWVTFSLKLIHFTFGHVTSKPAGILYKGPAVQRACGLSSRDGLDRV